MRHVAFAKANSCGNDFLIIDSMLAPPDIHSFSRAICDRHTGVGADGVEWVSISDANNEVLARLVNADGSEAEVSGNGTRCVAAYWIFRNGGNRVAVQTGAGLKECFLVQHTGVRYEFETAMGVPQINAEFEVAGLNGIQLSVGNPQFVVFASDFDFDWHAAGRAIQSEVSRFPNSTNVDFVRSVDAHTVESRFYERGAGATQSSGTGSCASAAAAIHKGLARSPVKVIAPGGVQRVRVEAGLLYLEGPAEVICEGEYLYSGN